MPRGDRLEPIFDIVKLSAWYRVDVERRFRKVLEDEDEIKLLQCELDTFQGSKFNLVKGDNEKRWLDEVNETFRRGL